MIATDVLDIHIGLAVHIVDIRDEGEVFSVHCATHKITSLEGVFHSYHLLGGVEAPQSGQPSPPQ